VVRGRGRCSGALSDIRLHLQEIVGFILDDVDIVLLSNLIDSLAAFSGLGGTGRVLAGGNGVQDERLARATTFLVPVAKDLIHGLGDKTLFVNGDTDGLQTKREGGFRGTGKGILFHENIITTLGQESEGCVPSISAAGSHCTLPVRIRGVVNDLEESQYL
jgi:hypothetical protein